MKTRLAAALAVLAALTPGLAAPARATSVPDPATDPFFVAPANLATLVPGKVIRQRAVTTTVIGTNGNGIPMPATSKQILVRSNDSHGRPAAVTATIVTPLFGAKHQVLTYGFATDSLGATCEPSYTLRDGSEREAAVVALAVGAGLTVVVPDHQGPRHAYGAGRMAGHAMLDATRGAITLSSSKVLGSATRVAMVGYSGGAIAAAWAAELQPSYAPELHLAGVASGGTPADLEAAGASMDGGFFGGLFVAAAIGMSREYPELRSVLNAKGVAFAEKVRNDCTTELSKYTFKSIKDFSDDPDPLRTPVARAVLAENKLGAHAPTAPYLLWQAKYDQLIPWASVNQLDKDWCARGADVKFVTNYTSEHISGVIEMIPTVLPWLINRLSGKPFTGNCPTR